MSTVTSTFVMAPSKSLEDRFCAVVATNLLVPIKCEKSSSTVTLTSFYNIYLSTYLGASKANDVSAWWWLIKLLTLYLGIGNAIYSGNEDKLESIEK